MIAGDVRPGDVVRLPDGSRLEVARVADIGGGTVCLVSTAGRRHYLGAGQPVLALADIREGL